MQELRRVSGKQLDGRFVEIFIELLEGEDVSFQHGEAADFEKELALEARIAETASPGSDTGRFQVPGVSGRLRRAKSFMPFGPSAGAIRFAAMRAVTYQAPGEVRIEEKPDPELSAADEAVVRVEASGICGSDLHIYHGRVPVEPGFTIGHEFVGTVLAAGPASSGSPSATACSAASTPPAPPAPVACAATTTAAARAAPSATAPSSATCRARRPSSCWCRAPT